MEQQDTIGSGSPGPRKGPRRGYWKYLYLALAGLALILSQLADLNEGTRQFVKQLDDGVFRAATNLNPLGLTSHYYTHLSGGERIEDVRHREDGPHAQDLIRTDADARLFGYSSLEEYHRQKEFEEQIRRVAKERQDKDRPPGPVRYIQVGRYVSAMIYTLRMAFAESWLSPVLTVVALTLAAVVIRDMLQLLNRKRPPSDYAWFWGVLLLGPLIASLLMLVLQGIMILSHYLFGMLLAASSVPLLVFLVATARDYAKKKADAAQRATP